MKKILGCDTETTGLLLPAHTPIEMQPRIIEICILVYDKNLNLIDEFDELIDPEMEIPFFIEKITKIENWMLKDPDVKPFKHYAKKLKKILESGKLFVAHNGTFDAGMLQLEFKRIGMKVKFPKVFCTVEQSMHVRGRRLKNDETYLEYTGEELPSLHRARSDIEQTMKTYRGMK